MPPCKNQRTRSVLLGVFNQAIDFVIDFFEHQTCGSAHRFPEIALAAGALDEGRTAGSRAQNFRSDALSMNSPASAGLVGGTQASSNASCARPAFVSNCFVLVARP